MGRAPCCDKATVKRGPWSPEEDARLRSYIHQHGTGGNWIALPRKVGLRRCGKSCRLRWLNYLRPDIRHGGFSEEEDRIICGLYDAIGSRWSLIAAQLPGRTDNDVKNYWNTRLKKKLVGTVGKGKPPSIIKSSSLQLHGDHYAANVNNAALNLRPPLLSSDGQPYGTIGSGSGSGSGGSGVHMHVGVGAGDGGSIGMATSTNATVVASHGYDAFAAGEPATNASYSCATTVATELDEIFRSISSTSGGGGDLSQCTEALLNWCQQGEGAQQQHLGMPYW